MFSQTRAAVQSQTRDCRIMPRIATAVSDWRLNRSVSITTAANMFPVILLCCCLSSAGCAGLQSRTEPSRLERGYTFVLPGIDSAGLATGNIVHGLERGGVETAVQVEDWTTGSPAFMLVHLRNEGRNRAQAREIAEKIVRYQHRHPGKPVNMIGFSGGGSMICYVLEELPSGHQIDSAILLSPAISPRYPVRNLLSKTRLGIWNFYSPLDVPLSIVGTTVVGTMDGEYTASAGAIGFADAESDSELRSGHATMPQLHQVPFRPSMIRDGNLGGHFGPTFTRFVQVHIAPLVR